MTTSTLTDAASGIEGSLAATKITGILWSLFDAPADPEHWRSVLASLAHALDSTGLALLFVDDGDGEDASHIVADVPRSTIASLCARTAPGRNGLALVRKDMAGVSSGAAGRVLCLPVPGSVGPAGRLVLFRALDAPEFDRLCKAALLSILPHIGRALAVAQRLHSLSDEAGWQSCGADLLPFGRLALDGKGRLLAGNRAARTVLAAADGLRVEGGRVVADSPLDNLVLQRRLGELLSGPGPGSQRLVRVRWRDGRGDYIVCLQVAVQKPPRFGIRMPKIDMIVINTLRAVSVSGETLAMIYGLTNAECEVARRLAGGERLQAVAGRLGITIPTARTHLHNIFAKTGVRRQAELIRRLIAPFGVCSLTSLS